MSNITMYGAEWCGDCRRSKKFLDANNVSYKYIDVEAKFQKVQINTIQI